MKWIRPIISLIAVSGITWGFLIGRIASDAYVGLMAVAITWWFRARDEEKRNGG